jgi:hypothetical protein
MHYRTSLLLLIAAIALPAFAQRWELGVGAGAGIYSSQTATARNQTASAGFEPGAAASVYLGQNLYRKWGGEIRYTWQQNEMKLQSGATKATFNGRSQSIHYDVLYHFRKEEDAFRPFIAAGGGMKYYEGTGNEVILQPLSNFAYLTRTAEWQPLISAGGGIKYKFGERMLLRIEARDYMTPFPKKVIAAAPGASLSGWLHDFLILAGLSLRF